jgi:hypothetical protein
MFEGRTDELIGGGERFYRGEHNIFYLNKTMIKTRTLERVVHVARYDDFLEEYTFFVLFFCLWG